MYEQAVPLRDRHQLFMPLHAAMRRSLLLLLLLVPLHTAAAQEALPHRAGDLIEEIGTLRESMPSRDSEGFVVPDAEARAEWEDIVAAFADERVSDAKALIQQDVPFYTLERFTDTAHVERTYLLLREKEPVMQGWGTYILNPTAERLALIEVPHPLFDTHTLRQGADLFRRTDARMLLIAGTHRCANGAPSGCDGSSSVCGGTSYVISDVAHSDVTPFHLAHVVASSKWPAAYAFNLHGTSRSSCEDIFLSNGHREETTSLLYDLRAILTERTDLSIGIAGDGTSACSLVGSTNVQGRFSNGSSRVCTRGTDTVTGRFIHVEQQRRVRDSLRHYVHLADAIREILPVSSQTTREHSRDRPILSVPHPHPFRRETKMYLTVRRSQQVQVDVYDLLGRHVARLYDGPATAGQRVTLRFAPHSDADGLFLCRVRGDLFTTAQPLVRITP